MHRDFADRLKSRRLAQGLSQTELGEKVGVTQPAVSSWERGDFEPRALQLTKLEKVLGPLTDADDDEDADASGQTSAFGAWLTKARNRANMSVPELASESGVSTVAIYNIESGKSLNPQERTKRLLANALKTDLPEDVESESQEEQQIQGLGSLVDFDPHDETARPNVAGVYVFYDISERPVYVGKSENIARRVAEHADAFWFRDPIVRNAAYIEIKEANLRHQVEQVLIRFLKSNAVINKQSVVRK